MQPRSSSAPVFLLAALAGSLVLFACEQPPNPALEHRKKGNELLERASFKEAAAEYEASLAADPKQEKLWDKIAFAYMKAGDTDKAAENLLKTLPFKKDDKEKLDVYRNVAGMYLQKSDGAKAEQYFSEALKIDPKDEQSLSWLAEIASQRGGARNQSMPGIADELEKAIGFYDRVIALNPNAPAAYVNKRIALMKYLGAEQQARALAEEEAKAYRRKSKDVSEAATARAKAHADKAQVLQASLDETTKKLGEVNKAAAAKKK